MPWHFIVPWSVGEWHFEWRDFKAKSMWPPKQFIRDTDLGWLIDDSGTEELDEGARAPHVRFEVLAQGVKRITAVAASGDGPRTKLKICGTGV